MTSKADTDPIPGLDRFEWKVGQETVGRAFDELGPCARRALLRAWTITRWTASDRLAASTMLHRVPESVREVVARAMNERFNPDPPPGSAGFVSVSDLCPTEFMRTFERIRQEITPAPAQRDLQPPPPLGHHACPEPRTPAEELRRTAITYFGGRIRPFTLEELGEFLGVSTDTLLQLRRASKTKAFTRGQIVRIPVEEAYTLITRNTV